LLNFLKTLSRTEYVPLMSVLDTSRKERDILNK
jgi:hypothetical protein